MERVRQAHQRMRPHGRACGLLAGLPRRIDLEVILIRNRVVPVFRLAECRRFVDLPGDMIPEVRIRDIVGFGLDGVSGRHLQLQLTIRHVVAAALGERAPLAPVVAVIIDAGDVSVSFCQNGIIL